MWRMMVLLLLLWMLVGMMGLVLLARACCEERGEFVAEVHTVTSAEGVW
jgi:hypothetical protein